jgi:hypothetical protein
MDQDFYFEETSPAKVIISILIFIIIIAGGIYYFLSQKNKIVVKLNNVTVELGDKVPSDNKTYLKCENPDNYYIDISKVSVDEAGNTNSTGEYSYLVKVNGEYKKGKIFVKDTTKPEVKVQDLTVGLNEEFMPYDFVESCTDLSLPCTARYKNITNEELNSKVGNYNVDIIISDNEGNEVEKQVKLIVSESETLLSKKESDLNFDHLSDEDKDWNKTYTLKLDKAIADGTARFDEVIEEISTKDYNFDKEVKDKVILVAYNKFNYAIGFSIKVTFNDGTIKYLTSTDSSDNKTNEEN